MRTTPIPLFPKMFAFAEVVATAGGRGSRFELAMSRGAAEEVLSPLYATATTSTTAFSRGYDLTPLRGWIRRPIPIPPDQ